MKNFLSLIFLMAIAMMFSSCGRERASSEVLKEKLTDSRDGQSYKMVKIGNQIWMAENLNLEYNQGSAKSYCYQNDSAYCKKYGRLYTWSAAMDSASVYSKDGERCGYRRLCNHTENVRGICPEGWHLPNESELLTLLRSIGAVQDSKNETLWHGAGKALKSTSGWLDEKGNNRSGSDAFNFSALPAGRYHDRLNAFDNEHLRASFWSSSEAYSRRSVFLIIPYFGNRAFISACGKNVGVSVRCVKN